MQIEVCKYEMMPAHSGAARARLGVRLQHLLMLAPPAAGPQIVTVGICDEDEAQAGHSLEVV